MLPWPVCTVTRSSQVPRALNSRAASVASVFMVTVFLISSVMELLESHACRWVCVAVGAQPPCFIGVHSSIHLIPDKWTLMSVPLEGTPVNRTPTQVEHRCPG